METRLINEQSLMIYFDNKITKDTYNKVNKLVQYIKEQNHKEIIDIVPSYRAILISFDNTSIDGTKLIENLELNQFNDSESNQLQQRKVVTIPVVYGEEFGPDLEEVASSNQLTTEEVIQIHTQQPYLIYMLGFMPGFPYLGGLDERIHTPRRSEPRVKIEAGSVGIANNQTGLYPLDSPGGWQIIGRTPLKVFDLDREPMTIYEAGEYIQFKAITQDEFEQIQADINAGNFELDKWVTYDNEY
ncbi:inhibitor of KinA [Staphylococcus pasteuri]